MRNNDNIENCNPVMIAIGGNLHGQKDSTLEQVGSAICEISHKIDEVVGKSKVYRTPCFPPGAGPDFVNAAVICESDKPAEAILNILHEIELQAGRKREQRWGPRVLDLDLLAVGDQICPDLAGYQHWAGLHLEDQMRLAPKELILPHPRMHERAFVLVPLMDIAPDWRHPVVGKTVAQMHAALDPADLAEIRPISQ
ncbi:2-amino-4-hydroxy-6-hydroxymethyldihydropteridine diphosphokinase [Roseinatronobacter bogoriensis]|nr:MULTISPECIES: 2-amino-4-hydroxy-6-hydroxymethyldihydropteridine diphosphokinase [Rhodobaca]TDW35404.1 2-amino-4-hydroxy-6-hydroxymethyldihydropteridine diphosphokinase [Rhodobaca barguzinensis]TDY66614.1 2-amino-4-hydroxy-6-hydroxymethyldihydropteridine diphosphokinase [Rhodobaca bogoriensis DSM 18756]